MDDETQLSLLQAALTLQGREGLGAELRRWQAVIPHSLQVSIHQLVPALALVLFLLVLWIFLEIIRSLPHEWYGPDPGVAKGEAGGRRERLPDESPPVDSSPVCASLTFPRQQARFLICADSLRNAKKLKILGEASKRVLLVALIGTKDGQPALRLCYEHCETDPRCSIQVVPDALGYDAFILRRKEELYGTLEKTSGQCLVRHNEVVTLKAEVSRITLTATATSPSGRQLARGGTESDGFWHLQVEPRADALLILATMVAAVRLW